MTQQPELEKAARACAQKCAEAHYPERELKTVKRNMADTLTPIILEAMRKVAREAINAPPRTMHASPATTSVPTGKRPLPTIDELQAILDDPTPHDITVNPDGSITAVPSETLESVRRELDEAKRDASRELNVLLEDNFREQVRVLRKAISFALKWFTAADLDPAIFNEHTHVMEKLRDALDATEPEQATTPAKEGK